MEQETKTIIGLVGIIIVLMGLITCWAWWQQHDFETSDYGLCLEEIGKYLCEENDLTYQNVGHYEGEHVNCVDKAEDIFDQLHFTTRQKETCK